LPVFLEYAIALGAIVVAAALFTNAVEIIGGRLSLGQGAVGSVLAAVGTALPETMIPVVAILAAAFAGRDPETAGEIGIGAILGAPFLLATLAMFVVGASALAFRYRRAQGSEIRCREVAADEFPWCKAPGKRVNIDADTIARDIAFFLLFFAVAAAVGVLELLYPLKVTLALLLIVAYALYVRRPLHSGAALRGGVGEVHAVAPKLRAAVVDRRRPGVACARAHSGGGPDLRGRRRTHRRGRRAACEPRRARVGSSGHRAAGEDQFRH
jgi:Ca2+/Na+ antiporter